VSEKKPDAPIIIKRVKKGGHGHHGGSWKVAYADFVTAMMAFFLLMWLLASASKEQKQGLSDYFSHYSVFDRPGVSFVEKGGTSKAAPGMDAKDLSHETQGAPRLPPETFAGEKLIPYELRGQELKAAEFAEGFRREAEEKLGALSEHVAVETTEDGVRIQLVDRQGRPMFDPGSGQPTALGKKALQFVAESIRGLPNLVALEGHTDAMGTHRGDRGNWQLSSARALAARDLLEADGVKPQRFLRVSGHADTRLYVDNDPTDPRNRRIAIMLWFPKSPAVAAPAP
jgi:chemotaxis protein MotB